MFNRSSYSTDDLTKKQKKFIYGIQAAAEEIDYLLADYEPDEDATVTEKMQCEIAQTVLTEARDRVESLIANTIVGFCDNNAYQVMDVLSRKKAEKKFGKAFVREVLD